MVKEFLILSREPLHAEQAKLLEGCLLFLLEQEADIADT